MRGRETCVPHALGLEASANDDEQDWASATKLDAEGGFECGNENGSGTPTESGVGPCRDWGCDCERQAWLLDAVPQPSPWPVAFLPPSLLDRAQNKC